MKKTIIAILIFALLFLLAACGGGIAKKYYAMTAVVQTVDVENDTVIIKNASGNTWTFKGIENWQVNDICSCIMDNKRTSSIYDDVIVSMRYDGQVIGWIIK